MVDLTKYSPEDLKLYITSGKAGSLPPDVVRYMDTLELVRSMYSKYIDKEMIIKTLMAPTYGLSRYGANKIITDTMNFFYSSNEVKQEAWKNFYADYFDKLSTYALHGKDDVDLARVCALEAAKARGVYDQQTPSLPPEMFTKPIVIYAVDSSYFGIEPANRNELAKIIDEFPDLSISEKKKLKKDAGVIPLNIPEDLEEANIVNEKT